MQRTGSPSRTGIPSILGTLGIPSVSESEDKPCRPRYLPAPRRPPVSVNTPYAAPLQGQRHCPCRLRPLAARQRRRVSGWMGARSRASGYSGRHSTVRWSASPTSAYRGAGCASTSAPATCSATTVRSSQRAPGRRSPTPPTSRATVQPSGSQARGARDVYATGTHLHGAETGRGDSPSAVGVSQRGRTERREGGRRRE